MMVSRVLGSLIQRPVQGFFALLVATVLFQGCNRSGVQCSTVAGSPDSSVYAMEVFNGELYVGGCFDSVGNLRTGYIAKWNGSDWTPVGRGLQQGMRGVEALCVFDGELYAAGDFEIINDTTEVEHIARWNGREWQPVGNGSPMGPFPYLDALCTYEGELYAAGYFDTLGGIRARNIARWNGEKWNSVGTGVGYTVLSLATFKGDLYPAGISEYPNGSISGTLDDGLAKWDGTSWSSLPQGIEMYTSVQSLTEFQNNLVIAGSFSTVGVFQARHVAFWNGSAFERFPSDLDDKGASMVAMKVHNKNLLVGGRVTSAVIMEWNGQDWKTVATDTNGYVGCFAEYKGDIYAGGSFRSLNGRPIAYLSKLTLSD
jgi:trimeric autotransporter adhesin